MLLVIGKPKVLELTEAQRLELDGGFRLGEKYCFRMRCRAVLLKPTCYSDCMFLSNSQQYLQV